MILICELEGNPCRDIVEGVTKLRAVRTVPFQEAKILVAKVQRCSVLEIPREGGGARTLFEMFHRKMGRTQFTTRQLMEFLVANGWLPGSAPLATTNSLLQRRRKSGAVLNLGHQAGDERQVWWQFAEQTAEVGGASV